MSQPPQTLNGDRAERLLKRLLEIGALIEMSVGLGVVAFPEQLIELLLNASLADPGVLVARLLGTALMALGLAWWFARNQPREPWARGCCLGFLVYNLGAGLWLMLGALTMSQRVALLWTLGLFHAGLGLALAALVLRRSQTSPKRERGSP
jgi:hypothetical protein